MTFRAGFAIALLSCSVPLALAQQIAVTVDDLPTTGPLPAGTTRLAIAESMLHAFHQERMPPVYGMVNGVRVQDDPATLQILQAWRAAGEPLGSHTWSHPSLNDLSAEAFTAEIARNEPLLRSLMADADWHWFRYPFLWEGDTLAKRRAVRAFLSAHGYRVAQVTMDFEDYLWNEPYARCTERHDERAIAWLEQSYLATAAQWATLYRQIAKTLYGRDISYVLLVHIGGFSARMMPQLLRQYRAEGFNFVSLETAEADPVYSEDPDLALKYGGPLTEQMMEKRGLRLPPGTKPYKELEAVCR